MPDHIKIYFDYADAIDKLPDADAGELLKKLLAYAILDNDDPPIFQSKAAEIAFEFIKEDIDVDQAHQNGY